MSAFPSDTPEAGMPSQHLLRGSFNVEHPLSVHGATFSSRLCRALFVPRVRSAVCWYSRPHGGRHPECATCARHVAFLSTDSARERQGQERSCKACTARGALLLR